MDKELLEAKRRLMLALIQLDEDTITDNELEMLSILTKDKQIQSLFDKNKQP